MRKLTRKLFISILAAVFAVVALGTSTFAWITVSNTAKVDKFNANVDAGEAGIELSLDGTKYYPILTKDMIDTKLTSFTGFENVTTSDAITFKTYTLSLDARAVLVESAPAGTYISFDIYVKNSNKTATTGDKLEVKLADTDITFEANNEGSFTSDVAGLTTTDKINVANAARIAFVDPSNNATVYEMADGNGNTLGFHTNGFAYQYLIKKGYKEFGTTDTGELGGNDISNLPKAPMDGATIFKSATRQIGNVGSDEQPNTTTLLTLDGQTAQKLTVKIWVEGWDDQCHHNILGQTLSVAFKFTSNVPAEQSK